MNDKKILKKKKTLKWLIQAQFIALFIYTEVQDLREKKKNKPTLSPHKPSEHLYRGMMNFSARQYFKL